MDITFADCYEVMPEGFLSGITYLSRPSIGYVRCYIYKCLFSQGVNQAEYYIVRGDESY